MGFRELQYKGIFKTREILQHLLAGTKVYRVKNHSTTITKGTTERNHHQPTSDTPNYYKN